MTKKVDQFSAALADAMAPFSALERLHLVFESKSFWDLSETRQERIIEKLCSEKFLTVVDELVAAVISGTWVLEEIPNWMTPEFIEKLWHRERWKTDPHKGMYALFIISCASVYYRVISRRCSLLSALMLVEHIQILFASPIKSGALRRGFMQNFPSVINAQVEMSDEAQVKFVEMVSDPQYVNQNFFEFFFLNKRARE